MEPQPQCTLVRALINMTKLLETRRGCQNWQRSSQLALVILTRLLTEAPKFVLKAISRPGPRLGHPDQVVDQSARNGTEGILAP